MLQVFKEILVPQVRWESRLNLPPLRSSKVTRVIQVFPDFLETQAVQDHLVPQVARRGKRESPEKQAKEENQERMETQAQQDIRALKENLVPLVFQEEMETEVTKATWAAKDLQDLWWEARRQVA